MTGRWRRDYSACLLSAFLPQFVCMSEKEDGAKKVQRDWMCWPERLLHYWKITKEKNQIKAQFKLFQTRNDCRWSVSETTQTLSKSSADQQRHHWKSRREVFVVVFAEEGKQKLDRENVWEILYINANSAYMLFQLIGRLTVFVFYPLHLWSRAIARQKCQYCAILQSPESQSVTTFFKL